MVAGPQGAVEYVEVLVRTTCEGFDDWQLSLFVPAGTTVAEVRSILCEPPNSLKLPPAQRVLKRLHESPNLVSTQESERVPDELLLLNYEPVAEPEEVVAEPVPVTTTPSATAPTATPLPSVPPPTPDLKGVAPSGMSFWHRTHAKDGMKAETVERLLRSVHAMILEKAGQHGLLPPRERRGVSWARTLSFGHLMLVYSGQLPAGTKRRGTKENPVRTWILGAKPETEGVLAAEGFWQDANFLDGSHMELTLVGNRMEPVPDDDSGNVRVQAMTFGQLLESSPAKPDMVWIWYPDEEIPAEMWTASSGAPIFVSCRRFIPEDIFKVPGFERFHPFEDGYLLLPPMVSPFAAHSWQVRPKASDNMCIVCCRNVEAFIKFLPAVYGERYEPKPASKVSTIFWGILDLKYDASAPLFDRVKVLETGDGRTSRFSGAGAPILEKYGESYVFEEGPAAARHNVISANKKLTHDLMAGTGFGHLLPQQIWFPRVYEVDLAERIATGLGVGPDDAVVLKLCNRTRAAGVMPVPVIQLDKVLKEFLCPPLESSEEWFHKQLVMGGPLAALGLKYGSYDEQMRHWWSNECPFFVVERLCTSQSSIWEGKEYDGTMRVAFALRKKAPEEGTAPAEKAAGDAAGAAAAANSIPAWHELEVDWLGGYWKLPKGDLSSANFRESIISAARTGTLPVDHRQLEDVYCALGETVHHMFGVEPTVDTLKQIYPDSPCVSSFLIAKLASSNRNQSKCLQMMEQANLEAVKIAEKPMRTCANSFVARAKGVAAYQAHGKEQLPQALKQIRRSLELYPLNCAALYLLGMMCLEEQGPEQQDAKKAVELMAKALLLDPDARGPYVNLGVAFLRLGRYDEAIKVSQAGLERHPQSPQCSYHIAVSCYLKSVQLEGAPPNLTEPQKVHADLRKAAVHMFNEARASEEAQKLLNKGKQEAPWSSLDDQVMNELHRHPSIFQNPRRLPPVSYGSQAGWRWYQWRV